MAKRISKSNEAETPAKPPARSKAPGASRPVRRNTAMVLVPPPSTPEPALATAVEPTEEDIRFHAYLRFIERGGDDGGAFDDWLQAERELKKGT